MSVLSRGCALFLLMVILCAAGCSGGSTDSRLVGSWKGRKGFAGDDIRVTFKSNGKATIKSDKTYSYTWSVSNKKKKTVVVNFKEGFSKSFKRDVKIVNESVIEMASSGGGVIRLHKD